jgi:hypothetical protein
MAEESVAKTTMPDYAYREHDYMPHYTWGREYFDYRLIHRSSIENPQVM